MIRALMGTSLATSVAKVGSLLLVWVLAFAFPAEFNSYASASIVSASYAALLLLGFPYILQLMAQDNAPKQLVKVLLAFGFVTCLSYVVVFFLHGGLSLFIQLILSSLPPLVVSTTYETLSRPKAVMIQAGIIVILQPVIYIIEILFHSFPLVDSLIVFSMFSFGSVVCFTLFFWFSSNYLKLGGTHFSTMLLGQVVSTVIFANSILNDNSLNVGLFWVIFQVGNIMLFIANTLSFQMLSVFSDLDANDKSKFWLYTSKIYALHIFVCLIISIVCWRAPSWAPFLYGVFLVSQSLSKVAGNYVLSQRRPSLLLAASFFASVYMAVVWFFAGKTIEFENVMLLLVSGAGVAAIIMFGVAMWYSHRLKSCVN